MKTMKSRCLLALIIVTWMVGCSPSAPVDSTLVYCSEGSPESFNPQQALSGTARDATATTIYDRLIDFKQGTTELEPALAERWTVSADRTTYDFELRRGVKFHRNEAFEPRREFNADDVIFSIERQRDEHHPYHSIGGGSYQYFQGMGMDKLIVSAVKLDDYKVRVVLSRPDATFLANMAMPFMSVLSAEYATKLSADGHLASIDTQPIGTGPYAFKSYLRGSTIRFTANAAYWKGRPHIDNLVFAITPDASVRLQKLKKGECHIAVSPAPADLPAIRKDEHLVLSEQDGLNVGYLAMNVEKQPFDSVLVRRAVAHALNKQSYVDAIYLGNATPAINPYPPTMWSYTDQVRVYHYDPEKAKALLAEAGYPHGFAATLWTLPVTRPYNPNGRKMGEMMQADLAKVGIRVELQTYDWATYLAKVKRGEHELVQLGWSGDNGDPDNFLYTLFSCDSVTRGSNNSRYCSPEFTEVISAARTTNAIDERKRLYGRALALLSEAVPVIPIAHSKVFRALDARVKGYEMSPLGLEPFANLTLEAHSR